jgi:hypothetical protein
MPATAWFTASRLRPTSTRHRSRWLDFVFTIIYPRSGNPSPGSWQPTVSSAFSLACKILALQSYVDVRSDARPAIEAAQAKLAVLTQEPAQIAENSTLALSILALSGNPNPIVLEMAA